MTATELYNAALANFGADGARYDAARHTLANGGVVICYIGSVAGRSIVARHRRCTWHYIAPGQEFSRHIRHERAAELLGA